MADVEQLDRLAARLRALKGVSATIAAAARPDVEADVRATASAKTDAYGDAWEPTKDGHAPLAGAAAAVSAVVSGTTKAVVTLVLRGYHVFHHFGTRRDPKRPILPDPKAGIPESITKIVHEAARRVVRGEMGVR